MDYALRVVGTALVIVVLVVGAMWFFEYRDRGEPVANAKAPEPSVDKRVVEEPVPPPSEPAAAEETPEPEPQDEPEPASKKPMTGKGVITGTVVHLQGEAPLAGATVTVEQLDWDLTKAPPADHFKTTTVSASDGTFEVRDLPIAPVGALYAVRAERDEFGGNFFQGVQLSRAAPKAEVKVTVMREYRITGTVRAIDGTPIENASLFIAKLGPQKLEVPPQAITAGRTSSDANGEFTLRQNWPVAVFIWAVADGYPLVEAGPININATDVVITLPPPLKVSGQVLLKDEGTPLGDVLVRLTHLEYGTIVSATTGADGEFAIDAIGPGSYKTYLYHDKCVIANLDTKIVVPKGCDVDGVVLYATMGATLSGRVYDEDTGRGVSGARMQVQTEYGNKFSETGSDGRYVFAALPACAAQVLLMDATGYRVPDNERRQSINTTLGDSIENVDFALSKGLTLSGIVLDPDGKPVADADVTARPQSGNWFGATSDKDGRFEIVSLMPSNDYQVWARAEGYACPPTGHFSVIDESVTGVTVQLCEEATMEGRIVTSQGNPARNVGAYARAGRGETANVEADAEGSFQLGGLHEGTYTVYAYRQIGYRWVSNDKHAKQITVGKGQHVTGVTLVFEEEDPGLAISGKVTNEAGEPIPMAFVTVHSGGWNQVHTNPNGHYYASGLSEGREYRIDVETWGYYKASQESIVAGSENVDFVLQKAATIEGQVVDARTNRPISEFEMYTCEGQRELESRMYNRFRTRFNSEGRFKEENVGVPSYTLFFRAKDYAIQTVRVDDIQPGETRRDVLVALEPAVVIQGIVKNTTGKAVANASIFVGDVPERWRRDERGVTVSAADGTFTVESVPEDVILMSAVHPNYAPGCGIIAANGHVEIVLGVGGVMRGRVTEGGQPVQDARVSIQRYTESGHSINEGSLQTNRDGYYEMAGLVPGDFYEVDVYLPVSGRHRSRKNLVVTEGIETQADFAFVDPSREDAASMDRLANGPIDIN